MVGAVERLESLLDYGGLKKDIVVLTVSAVSLILSLALPSGTLPFDPAWIAVFLCGTPILIESASGLILRFDIKADVLVSVALIASICIGEIFAAGEVAAIMILGSVLEDYTAERARKGISKLMDMRPETARVIRGGEETVIPAKEVRVGDIIKVLAGESIPVDGVIVSGTTSVDQSMMTGEPIPVDKTAGDEVMSGTVNRFGVFTMEAAKAEEDSSIERMIRLMEEADAGKSPVVRTADRWATWIVIMAMAAALTTYLVTNEIIRAVTVLVVFCPCAFILATPTAVAAAIANSSRHGVLVRSGAAMERLSKVDVLALDKTGTITHGTPSVTKVISVTELTNDELHRICATAEKESEHPLGKAITDSWKGETGTAEGFVMIPGKGVSCRVDGHGVLIGNPALMKENGIDEDEESIHKLFRGGETVIHVAVDGVISGYLALEDVVKDGCDTTIGKIRNIGIEPVLMTGDNGRVASKIAASAGIDSVISDCLPDDKLGNIGRMQSEGRVVCMVGDGINDAPALKKADVGISMGGIGSDIAIEASDITVVNDDIGKLPHLFGLSKKMMSTINLNIFVSMALNLTAIVLAATAVLNPITGALVHNVGSVLVVINSALIIGWSAKKKNTEKRDEGPALKNTQPASITD